MTTLPQTPATLAAGGRQLAWGRYAGGLATDPVRHGPRGGHARRWLYAAAAGEEAAVGAAVVDPMPGWVPVVVAFAWARLDDEVVTWERRLRRRPGNRVGRRPVDGAMAVPSPRTGQHVRLGADGRLRIEVELHDGRWLSARVDPDEVGAVPLVLATTTPRGGWNVTQKLAGVGATGRVGLDGRVVALDGGAWTDWTAGRQDRETTWRWAAAAGTADDGRLVGLNTSTGMNAAGAGEDAVWWDGTPVPLGVRHLAPTGQDAAAAWRVAGDGWSLQFRPHGVRAAHEDLGVVRSHYVQPIGTFRGTLPGPDGVVVPVRLHGVTEDHEARW